MLLGMRSTTLCILYIPLYIYFIATVGSASLTQCREAAVLACVEQQEAASAVCVLGLFGSAPLPQQSGMLVT